MKKQLNFLNSKERKRFFGLLEEQFGYNGSTDYVVATNSKQKFFVVNREIDRLPLEELNIDRAGLYVGEEHHGELRLSLDGAQLFGPHCNDCFFDVDVALRDTWMRGEVIASEGEDRFVIVRWDGHILGCGKRKQGEILNYVPKERRIQEPHSYAE